MDFIIIIRSNVIFNVEVMLIKDVLWSWQRHIGDNNNNNNKPAFIKRLYQSIKVYQRRWNR